MTVPITEKGYGFMPDFLYRFATHFYGGIRYRYLDFKTAVEPQYLTVGGQPIFPGVDFVAESRVRSSGLGLVMNYDSRDNGFYPYRWKRWGMVAFGGVGKVGRDLQDFDTKDLLPSAGVGLRFLAWQKERVYPSIDYARGREGDAIYYYIGEAF